MKNQHLLIVLFVIILSPLTALAADGPTDLFDLPTPTDTLVAQSPGPIISSIAPMQAPDCPKPVVVYTQVWGDKSRVVAEFDGRFVAVTDWGDMASAWGPSVACNDDFVLIAHHQALSSSGRTVIFADLFDLTGEKQQGPIEFPNSKNSIQNPRCSTNADGFTCVYTDFSKGRYGQRFLSVEINSTGEMTTPEPIAPTAQFQVYSSIGCDNGTCIVAGAIHDTTNLFVRKENGSWIFLGSLAGQLPTVSVNASTKMALVMTNVTNVSPNRLHAVTVDLETGAIQPISLGSDVSAMDSGHPTGDLLSYSAAPVLHGWVIAVWNRTGNTVWPHAVNLPASPTLNSQAVGEWTGFPSVGTVGHLINWCHNISKDGKGAEPYSVKCELQVPPGVSTVFLPALGW